MRLAKSVIKSFWQEKKCDLLLPWGSLLNWDEKSTKRLKRTISPPFLSFNRIKNVFFIKLFSITNQCNILPNGLLRQCFGPIASFVPLLSFSVMFCSLLNGKWCDILPRGFPSNWSKRPTIFFCLSPVFHLCRSLSHHV